jgi:hypothetical protein
MAALALVAASAATAHKARKRASGDEFEPGGAVGTELLLVRQRSL